ncbi:MAG TPA: Na+/H+ antiporter subunit D [Bacteroides sp.]|nr:Na+/H+ antiporter subunit D [Bacteroides sp.]
MNAVALPILIPLALMVLLIVIRSALLSRWTGVLGSMLMLVIAIYLFSHVNEYGILILQVGEWAAPFGITLVIDRLSSLMLLVTALLLLSISIYAIRFIGDKKEAPVFYIFFFSLAMGINGAFITGDVFNLYVWFEVMLLSSFVLISMGSTREQLKGGIKYVGLNLIGSLFFLAGIGLLYGKTGTLNMAHLAKILQYDEQSILMNSSAMLFFIAFGIKAAIFPLYFWLPASYHTPNITITSLFAGLLTKVGVYALIRFFTLFFVQDQVFWHNLLLVVAGLTMVIGGIAASTYYETRRILSYHIISQIGYMVMGLGIYTPLALAGAIYFIMHNMVAKTNAFLVSGLINRFMGSYRLKEVGGLYRQSPLLALLFIIPAFALAGVPPLSGFFAKFILIKAGIEASRFGITAVALITGLLTLYSMIKIWNEAFLKKLPENQEKDSPVVRIRFLDVLPSLILGLVTILMGVFAAPVFRYTMEAANGLLDPFIYIESVLNGIQP